MVEGRTHRPVVDHEACSACAVCRGGCPAERVREMRLEPGSLRGRVYGDRTSVSFSPFEPTEPPCRAACPLGQDVPGYVRLLSQGRTGEALDRILEHNPLPGVCGYVCTRPCEAACTRGRADGPVPIRTLKAYAALRGRGEVRATASGPPEVAVVGSGPAGLTVVHDLARGGIRSVLFESHDRPGGIPAWAIPRFRLPADVLDRDIERILAMGVDLQTGTRFGADVTLDDLRGQGIRALVLATGTPGGLTLGIPEEDCTGVEEGLAFLRRVHQGDHRPPGRRVLVVGGGNAAMDAARTARRLGAEVTVVYRRDRLHMPADPAEAAEAEREGVAFRFRTAPVRVIPGREGGVQGLACIRTELRTVETGARPRPASVPGTEHDLTADAVVVAVGQRSDPGPILQGIGAERTARFRLDPSTPDTGCTGVFAAGDLLSGPTTVVEAMAGGRRTARRVQGFLEQGGSL